jgi:hypothetical protein
MPVKSVRIMLLFLVMAPGAAIAQSAQSEQADKPAANSPAPAPTTDADGDIVVEGDVPKNKRKVCETRTSTGSIVPRRVCRTVAQVEEDERAARDAIDSVNRDRETRDTIQANRGPGL